MRAQPMHATAISGNRRDACKRSEVIVLFDGPPSEAGPSVDLERSGAARAKAAPVQRDRDGRRARSAPRRGADLGSAAPAAIPRPRRPAPALRPRPPPRLWKAYLRVAGGIAGLIGGAILTIQYFVVLPPFAWLARRAARREQAGWTAIAPQRNDAMTRQY